MYTLNDICIYVSLLLQFVRRIAVSIVVIFSHLQTFVTFSDYNVTLCCDYFRQCSQCSFQLLLLSCYCTCNSVVVNNDKVIRETVLLSSIVVLKRQ